MAIWSTVEPGVGITAGCAVTLRPLLRLCLQKLGIRSTEFSDHPGSQQLPRSHGYSRNPGVTNESSKQQSQSRKPDDPYTLRSLAFYDDTERIVTITGGKNDDDRASSLENVKTTTVFHTYDKPSSPNPSPSPRAWEGV